MLTFGSAVLISWQIFLTGFSFSSEGFECSVISKISVFFCHKTPDHGLINYKDIKAKCRRLKILPVKGLCGRCLYLSEAPSPPMTPYPPSPLHTVYVYTVYLYPQGWGMGGGGVELTREKVRGETVHKVGSKIPTWLTVSPVYKLW
jgi:hypothetical protein